MFPPRDQTCFEHHVHGPECYGESTTTKKLRALAKKYAPAPAPEPAPPETAGTPNKEN